MLFRHDLEVAEVDAPAPGTYEAGEFDLGRGDGTVNWKRSLVNVIARNNFCNAIVLERRSAFVTLLGEAHNIEFAHYLYHYLKAEIVRLCELEMQKPGTFIGRSSKTWRNNFFLGAVATINDRLRVQREQDTFADASSTAPVSTKDAELDAEFNKRWPRASSLRSSHTLNRGAQEAGRRAAQGIGLDRPVGAGYGGSLALSSGK